MNGQIDKLYAESMIETINGQQNQKIGKIESENLVQNINNEEKALIKGILLGSKEELTEKQVDNYKISNLSHILAVSGMHIAYIVIGVMFILKSFKISKQKQHIVTILVIIFFMFLTEFTPSVVRASIMAIIVLIAFLLKRKSDVWVNISIASLVSLIDNPYTLFSLSYQLSYLGTIGIILGMKVVNEYRKRNTGLSEIEYCKKGDSEPKEYKNIEKLNKIKKYFIDTIIVCLSAQLFVFPIILLNFNTFSLYFLISNLLITPIIGIIIILGFLIIFLSYISFPLAFYLNYIEKFLLEIMNKITEFIAELPYAIVYLKTPYLLSIIIYFAVLLFLIGVYIAKEAVIKRKIKKYYKFTIKMLKRILIVYLIIIIAIDLNIFQLNTTKIYFIDVGQGDSSLIITEKNKKILIDGGGSSDENYDLGENVTLPYLLDRRISKLDHVVISHFDSDHVQGLFAVLENIKVKNVVISKQYESTTNFQEFLDIIKSKKINLILAKKGDILQVDRYSKLEILFPLEDVKDYISQNAINNNSIVCKYVDRNISVLYTGDIEKVAEEQLIKLYKGTNKLKTDILKVAHHGSKSSTIDGFIELVKPKVAVICVGKNNTFGHPNEAVLERLENRKILVRRTDLEGEIEFVFSD